MYLSIYCACIFHHAIYDYVGVLHISMYMYTYMIKHTQYRTIKVNVEDNSCMEIVEIYMYMYVMYMYIYMYTVYSMCSLHVHAGLCNTFP